MSRTIVQPAEHFARLYHALEHGGALLVSLDEAKRPNPMTIGWAQVGIIWGKPICTVLVRPSRYTYGCCNATGDFTVNVPYPSQSEALLFCGTKSGRDHDKFAECGLSAAPARCGTIASPYIAECGLALECRIVSHLDLDPGTLDEEVAASCYPSGDFHRLYFGEILCTHAEEEFLRNTA